MTPSNEMPLPPQSNLRIGTFVREGSLHSTLSLGCQDACHVSEVKEEKIHVVVICDGCSSNDSGLTHNQVGAILGSYYFADSVAHLLIKSASDIEPDDLKFEEILKSSTKSMRKFFGKMMIDMMIRFRSESWDKFVLDKLLFTILGFAIVRNQYWVFGFGDGCYGIDDDIIVVDAPLTPYFGESLLEKNELATLTPQIYKSGTIEFIRHLWVSSDGLEDVLSVPQGKKDFFEFVEDDFTCSQDSKGNDRTIQAFRRRVVSKNPKKLSDDIALAILKTR